MDFASHWPDWPAYALVFIAVIAAAFSLNRLSWPLVVGTVAILASFAVEDTYPSLDSRVIGAALLCAIAAGFAMRRRLGTALVVVVIAVGFTAKSFVPHSFETAIVIVTMAVAGGVSELQSKAR